MLRDSPYLLHLFAAWTMRHRDSTKGSESTTWWWRRLLVVVAAVVVAAAVAVVAAFGGCGGGAEGADRAGDMERSE